VAIRLSTIKQGCCNDFLDSFNIIDGDSLDDVGSTCDKIIECEDKYILIEEKSLLIGFFDRCCNELGNSLDDYKYTDDDVEYLQMTQLQLDTHALSSEVKMRLLEQTRADLLATSARKASNTTHLLSDKSKTANMDIFYLYCNSGKPIDKIIYTWLSSNRKNIFIECQDLKERLDVMCTS